MAVSKLTTSVGNNEPVMQVRNHSALSAQDLEAEIAHAASAIGGGKTVDGTHIPKHKLEAAKKEKTKSKTKSKTKAKSKATKKNASKKVSKKTEDAPVKTVVKVRKKSDTDAEVENEPTIELKKSSTIIEGPPSSQQVEPKAELPSATSHHEKVINPISSATKVERTPEPEAEPEPEATSEPEVEQTKVAEPESAKETAITQEETEPQPTKPSITVTDLRKKQPTKLHPKAKIGGRVVGMDIAPSTLRVSSPAEIASPTVATEEELEQKISPKTEEVIPQSTVARNARHGHANPHAARIYDTSTYHMPLEVNHHHRKVSTPLWVQIVVVCVGVASLLILALVTGYPL